MITGTSCPVKAGDITFTGRKRPWPGKHRRHGSGVYGVDYSGLIQKKTDRVCGCITAEARDGASAFLMSFAAPDFNSRHHGTLVHTDTGQEMCKTWELARCGCCEGQQSAHGDKPLIFSDGRAGQQINTGWSGKLGF